MLCIENWPKRKITTLSGLEIPKCLGIFSPVQFGQRRRICRLAAQIDVGSDECSSGADTVKINFDKPPMRFLISGLSSVGISTVEEMLAVYTKILGLSIDAVGFAHCYDLLDIR